MIDRHELARRLREAGAVSRAHTLPHIGEYSVGLHSWNAAQLVFALHPDPSLQLIKYVMTHDCGERYMGDLPAPVKKQWPSIAEAHGVVEDAILWRVFDADFDVLSYDEQLWAKGADRVEFYCWCVDQLAFGNQHVSTSTRNIVEYIKNMTLPKELRDFYDNYTFRRGSDTP